MDLYVIESELGSHRLAMSSLRDENFRVILPTYLHTRYVRGQRKEREVPLFFNYMFVELTELDMDTLRWCRIRRMRGVRSIYMGANDRPVALPSNDATRIIAEFCKPIDIGSVLPVLEKGTRVNVTEGPFAGFNAEVLEQETAEEIKLQVWLFSRAMEVFVKRGYVEVV